MAVLAGEDVGQDIFMGFYHCVCMLTGVSLRPSDAVAVLLRKRDQSYAPIALPVFGNYDQQGGIDSIEENAHTRLLIEFFTAQLHTGRFVAQDYFHDHLIWPEPSADYFSVIDGLFGLVERNTTMWHFSGDGTDPYVTIDGDPVVFALLARPVWDAIVDSAEQPTATDTQLLNSAFGADVIAHDLYDDHLSEVAPALSGFAVVNDFLRAHEVAWTPPGFGRYGTNYHQHFEEMAEYLQRARVDWRDSPAIQTAIDQQAVITQVLLDQWARDEQDDEDARKDRQP
jgi:hypothetical protein